MRKQENHDIPITKNCTLAVSLDMKKKTETVLIGEPEAVKEYMEYGSSPNLLFSVGRDMGLLLQDYIPIAGEIADIRVVLTDSTGRGKSPYYEKAASALTKYYQSDNPIYRFTALLMWQEYHRALRDRNTAETLPDTLEDVTLALRFNMMDEVKNWQEFDRKNPLAYLDRDFRKYPVSLLFDGDKQTREYAMTDKSPLSIAVYYLKRIYDNGRYIQTCPICGRAFVAKTAGMTTLCSDACRRVQGKENKRRFDERAKTITYERASKNAYMYWYNKIAKLRKMNLPKKEIEDAERLFKIYSDEAAKRKKDVTVKKADAAEYESWLLAQRNVIDGLMERLEGKK
jgi:predicted nucleic acid-binding Zn ribbon protein